MSSGTIKKVVKVAVGDAPKEGGCVGEGYGIIRSSDGRDVFFVNSVVQDGRFEELQQGQEVLFTIEDGPLGRAAVVKLR